MNTKNIVILFSGSGTNLENIIQKLHNKIFNETKLIVNHTICNIPNAKGIQKAQNHNIKVEIVDHTLFNSREDFDQKLVSSIQIHQPDVVVLAGFMRILSPIFTKNVKAINLHPSLLPLFKGANAIRDSWESDEIKAGISVHFVSDELDGGEIIEQSSFDKKEYKTFEEFEKKIHELEYELLPKVIINLLSSPLPYKEHL